MLLPPRKLPAWVNQAAAESERRITASEADNATATQSPASSDAPTADDPA